MVPRIDYLIFNSIFKVEGLRLQQYNTRNEDHEKQLLRLWKLLKPNEELEDRKSDQWQSIGFQGQLLVFLTFAPKPAIAIYAPSFHSIIRHINMEIVIGNGFTTS